MKTFCKLTAQSPARPMCRSRRSFSKMKPCGASATTRRYSMRCCWTEQAFPGRTATSSRTAQFGCTSPWSRRRRSCTAAAKRHTDIPRIGVQRLDCSAQAGLGQARAHYAELPSGCKADSAKREWRNVARIKVENKVFSAPQVLRKHRGISFPITPQKSVSMRLQKR